jgi:hypothetical protein
MLRGRRPLESKGSRENTPQGLVDLRGTYDAWLKSAEAEGR